jgi:hypothetical protein
MFWTLGYLLVFWYECTYQIMYLGKHSGQEFRGLVTNDTASFQKPWLECLLWNHFSIVINFEFDS